jgi:hypothetical protein
MIINFLRIVQEFTSKRPTSKNCIGSFYPRHRELIFQTYRRIGYWFNPSKRGKAAALNNMGAAPRGNCKVFQGGNPNPQN